MMSTEFLSQTIAASGGFELLATQAMIRANAASSSHAW